jgi:hypothetical protein
LAVALVCVLLGAKADDIMAQRRAQIEAMTGAQKEVLLGKYERFQKLNEAEQRRLRELDLALITDPEGVELRAILQRYHAWMEKLPGVQRAELSSLPTARRLEQIEKLLQIEAWQRERNLSRQDLQVMAEWLEQFISKGSPADRQRAILRMLTSRSQPFEPGRAPALNDLMQLREKLSPKARDQLTNAGTQQQRQELMALWFRQAMTVLATRYSQAGEGPPPPERLQEFFDSEVSKADRDRLLMLPAEEMQGELRRMYQFRSLVPGGGKGPMGKGPPGKGRPKGSRP